MSNFRTVAQATQALCDFIHRTVQADLPTFGVTVVPQKPFQEPPPDPTITVFLYEVVPNASLRNIDEPTRSPDGTLVNVPRAAIDLHYVISFYGDERELQPQQMLGSVVRHLNADPVLADQDLQSAATRPFLLGADLAAARQRVRLTPTKLDVDDLYKLWTMLIQIPYALSVMYAATAVVLDGDGVPAAGKPVLQRTVRAVAGGRPVVSQVLSRPAGSNAVPQDGPVPTGSEVLLVGSQLRGDGVVVHVGDQQVTPTQVRDDLVVFTFPQDQPPGVYPVSVALDVSFSDSSGPHVLRQVLRSTVTPVVWQPRVVQVTAAGGQVTTRLDLPVLDTQRVFLLLDELNPPATRKAAGYQFSAPFPLGDRTDPTVVQVATPGVVVADYLVRVQVDGVPSYTAPDLSAPTVHLGV
jgi:hypothetical protein